MFETLKFFQHRTNWHKAPGVRSFLCWIGRHDYEFMGMLDKQWADMRCFYCWYRKQTRGMYKAEINDE